MPSGLNLGYAYCRHTISLISDAKSEDTFGTFLRLELFYFQLSNSLIMKITAIENDINDILQTFR